MPLFLPSGMTSGEAKHLVGNCSCMIHEGDMLILHPGVIHGYDKTDNFGIINLTYDYQKLGMPVLDGYELPLFQRMFPSQKILFTEEEQCRPAAALSKQKLPVFVELIRSLKQELEDGKQIDSTMTSIVAQTDTELVAPAKKGDTVIKVKDGSKWKVRSWSGFVYNSDPSLSDLPNRNYLACPLKEMKQEGDAWTLTFSRPLKVDLPAGTKVRQHSGGGYMYTGKYGQLTGDWKTFTGSAKGLLKAGFNYAKFAPGTARVSVLMLVNWGNKIATAEIKDISLEIK